MEHWKSIYAHKWTDDTYNHGITFLKKGTFPTSYTKDMQLTFKKRMEHYRLLNDSLVYVSKSPPPWLLSMQEKDTYTFYVVRPSEIDETIESFFKKETHMAMNYRTLYDKIIRSYFLGISRQNVLDFLKSKPLNLRQLRHKNPNEFIQSYRPMYPFHYWQIDTIDMQKIQNDNRVPGHSSLTYKHILVIIDIFSKFVYIYPLIGNIKDPLGKDIERMYAEISNILRKIFLNGDIPEKIGADNAFKTKAFESLCKDFNVQINYGLPYNPQTQGFVENKNKQIKAYIYHHFNKFDQKGKYKYFDILDSIAFSINNTKHSMTSTTPMQLHRGREIPVMSNNNVSVCPESFPGSNGSEFVQDEDGQQNLTTFNLELEKCDKQNMQNYNEKSKLLYDQRVDIIRNRLHKIAEKRESIYASKHLKNTIELGSYVQIRSYINSDKQIQLVQLRLYKRGMDYDNDSNFVYLENSLKKNDIRKYNPSEFEKQVYKSRVHIWKHKNKESYKFFRVAKFTKTDKKTNQFYGLVTLDDQYTVEWKESSKDESWSSKFYNSKLLLADTKEVDTLLKSNNVFQKRPTYSQAPGFVSGEIPVYTIDDNNNENTPEQNTAENMQINNENMYHYDQNDFLVSGNKMPQLSNERYQRLWSFKDVHKKLKGQEIVMYMNDKKVIGKLGNYNQNRGFEVRFYNIAKDSANIEFEGNFIKANYINLEKDYDYVVDQVPLETDGKNFVFRFPYKIVRIFFPKQKGQTLTQGPAENIKNPDRRISKPPKKFNT